MKKIYLKPETEEIVLNSCQSLLAGSPLVKSGSVNEFEDLLTREFGDMPFDITE